MRRVVDPDLKISLDLNKGDAADASLAFTEFRDLSDPYYMIARLTNHSNQPAMYVAVALFVDHRVQIFSAGPFQNAGGVTIERGKRHLLRIHVGVHHGFPIFKEMPNELGMFSIRVKDRLLGQRLDIGYTIRSPGCFREAHGHLEVGARGQLRLQMPG